MTKYSFVVGGAEILVRGNSRVSGRGHNFSEGEFVKILVN